MDKMNNEKNDRSFLGTGWSFPPTFDAHSKILITVSDEEDIRQSLHILLSTQITERIMLRDFGCDLSALLFENITTTILTKIRVIIERAILVYEPRVKMLEINFERSNLDEGLIHINLIYLIRSINTRGNIVFPFYVKEGTYVNR